MGLKAAARVSDGTYKQGKFYGQCGHNAPRTKVCSYWLAGTCNRNPCRFLHRLPTVQPVNEFTSGSKNISRSARGERGRKDSVSAKAPDSLCHFWALGDCVKGDSCRFLHSWFQGSDFALLTKLEGHKKSISGIALPPTSNKLYSGGRDGMLQIWDCYSGLCSEFIRLGAEVGSVICEGPWVFVGLTNSVKALNTECGSTHHLSGPVGQVLAMAVARDMLFAAIEDGTIRVWKAGTQADPFLSGDPLKGHSCAVMSLIVGGNRLYSGSVDGNIRVWDIDTLTCIEVLHAHTDTVTSLLCWDCCLLSCSLDGTIKAWVVSEVGTLEVIYTHKEDAGILVLCGMHDSEAKPILLSALKDNTVRLYDLPSFAERGKLFSRKEVTSIQVGPRGLFFTGDALGTLNVWKWHAVEPKQQASDPMCC
ncbi:hypothetical protein MLD38_021375 [Melastoma candidum]|uniref:Uncharacterized protein n=1 Tax=Melastoma candidum TaxID=119954 RepID=A0ACB9QG20_9MYRT|nr:hypothetical protein MLD38_021375 [Melastoma candidum]